MKTLQLANYIIGRLMKEEKIFYDEDDENIHFTEGYTIHKIPKNDNFIDLDKVKKVDTSYLMKKYDPVKAMMLENIQVYNPNAPLGVLYKGTCKGEELYFYKDRLKYFSKNYKLYKVSTKPYAPVYVLENGELKGCFLPARTE